MYFISNLLTTDQISSKYRKPNDVPYPEFTSPSPADQYNTTRLYSPGSDFTPLIPATVEKFNVKSPELEVNYYSPCPSVRSVENSPIDRSPCSSKSFTSSKSIPLENFRRKYCPYSTQKSDTISWIEKSKEFIVDSPLTALYNRMVALYALDDLMTLKEGNNTFHTSVKKANELKGDAVGLKRQRDYFAAMLRRAIPQCAEVIDAKNADGKTPLELAVQNNDYQLSRWLAESEKTDPSHIILEMLKIGKKSDLIMFRCLLTKKYANYLYEEIDQSPLSVALDIFPENNDMSYALFIFELVGSGADLTFYDKNKGKTCIQKLTETNDLVLIENVMLKISREEARRVLNYQHERKQDSMALYAALQCDELKRTKFEEYVHLISMYIHLGATKTKLCSQLASENKIIEQLIKECKQHRRPAVKKDSSNSPKLSPSAKTGEDTLFDLANEKQHRRPAVKKDSSNSPKISPSDQTGEDTLFDLADEIPLNFEQTDEFQLNEILACLEKDASGDFTINFDYNTPEHKIISQNTAVFNQ
ncbi:DgyrCDS2217 [Dimorphilus gyrociliatus]|uniref:DgyrCDS2217 n=1 Tax=Dimorphilus gyrociliatus TaxID=2664684 RepID=A0A7I8VCD4_9ANNE|nr:DgyrCDS2217 [Dimorphilus gyrociliatus]